MIRRPSDIVLRLVPSLVCGLVSLYLAWNAGPLLDQLYVVAYELVPSKGLSLFLLAALSGLGSWFSYFLWSRFLRKKGGLEDWILASPEFLVTGIVAACLARALLAFFR